jgi:restriction endonuclease S subunit
MKNGVSFTAVVNADDFVSGIWDPYYYKSLDNSNVFSDYVEIKKTFAYKFPLNSFKYSPIEYKDIPRGNHLTFNLTPNVETDILAKYFAVPEETLLLGTMRAYLGNVVITPKSNWLKEENTWLPINSEFCEIIPHDNLKYFWFAFLKSPLFLNNIPTGTGGTRPRVNPEQLYQIPIIVPALEERTAINSLIEKAAEKIWMEQHSINNLFSSLF